jgi:nucleotide-binding universal stress UspA family protein
MSDREGRRDEGGKTAPRIVVGVDGSSPSLRALRWAAHQAKLTGAALEIITCWELPTSYAWFWEAPPESDPGGDVRRNLQMMVAGVLGDDPGIDVELTAVEGHPSRVLLDAARGASLLVVGSRGHGEFTGMLLGSVSNYCVSHASCPVTAVREVDGRGNEPSRTNEVGARTAVRCDTADGRVVSLTPIDPLPAPPLSPPRTPHAARPRARRER